MTPCSRQDNVPFGAPRAVTPSRRRVRRCSRPASLALGHSHRPLLRPRQQHRLRQSPTKPRAPARPVPFGAAGGQAAKPFGWPKPTTATEPMTATTTAPVSAAPTPNPTPAAPPVKPAFGLTGATKPAFGAAPFGGAAKANFGEYKPVSEAQPAATAATADMSTPSAPTTTSAASSARPSLRSALPVSPSPPLALPAAASDKAKPTGETTPAKPVFGGLSAKPADPAASHAPTSATPTKPVFSQPAAAPFGSLAKPAFGAVASAGAPPGSATKLPMFGTKAVAPSTEPTVTAPATPPVKPAFGGLTATPTSAAPFWRPR